MPFICLTQYGLPRKFTRPCVCVGLLLERILQHYNVCVLEIGILGQGCLMTRKESDNIEIYREREEELVHIVRLNSYKFYGRSPPHI